MNTRALVIILIILFFCSYPQWPWASSWGYLPFGGLGGLLMILLILALCGVI